MGVTISNDNSILCEMRLNKWKINFQRERQSRYKQLEAQSSPFTTIKFIFYWNLNTLLKQFTPCTILSKVYRRYSRPTAVLKHMSRKKKQFGLIFHCYYVSKRFKSPNFILALSVALPQRIKGELILPKGKTYRATETGLAIPSRGTHRHMNMQCWIMFRAWQWFPIREQRIISEDSVLVQNFKIQMYY